MKPGVLSLVTISLLAGLASAQFSHSTTSESGISEAISEIEGYSVKVGTEPEAVEVVYGRSHAAIARLGRAGSSALPKIRDILGDLSKDWKVKAMMCEALGKMEDAEAAALLEQVLKDKGHQEFVRAVAGHALAGMGRAESAPTIEQIVSDRTVPAKVRARTMMALGAAGFDDVEWLKRAAVGEGLGFSKDEPLSQEEGGIILNAQRAFEMSKNPGALDALLELQEKYPTNGIYTDILRKRKDKRSIPVLIRVLTYKGPNRSASLAADTAALALGDMKARDAVDPLIEIVKIDPDEILVGKAALALANIGDKKALQAIQNVVDHLHSDPRFTKTGDSYFVQEKDGNGPIPMLRKALNDLRSQ